MKNKFFFTSLKRPDKAETGKTEARYKGCYCLSLLLTTFSHDKIFAQSPLVLIVTTGTHSVSIDTIGHTNGKDSIDQHVESEGCTLSGCRRQGSV